MVLFHHMLPKMMYSLATSPKATGLTNHKLKPTELEPKQTFPLFLSGPSQVFYYSNRKLSNIAALAEIADRLIHRALGFRVSPNMH
jgi:hypothetical protein